MYNGGLKLKASRFVSIFCCSAIVAFTVTRKK